MKKIITILGAIAALCLAASCEKVHDEGFFFSPSSITIGVGESADVSYEIYMESGGYAEIRFECDTTYVHVTAESFSNTITITGVRAGNTEVRGYLKDYPNIKGSCAVTVR